MRTNRSRRPTARVALGRRAARIERALLERHAPHGAILDPIFEAPDSQRIVDYTRAGDSAIWTGHYLAAQTFRYVVTQEPAALENLRMALWAIGNLVHVTGTDLLARFAVPANSPWAASLAAQEAHNLVREGRLGEEDWIWAGRTSRDQYLGVFFGLSAAYEWILDTEIRTTIADLVTRLLGALLDDFWTVRMPDGTASTTFATRVDQRLALLQVGRQVNDARFGDAYRGERFLGSLRVGAPLALETLDPHGSYFKFNLDVIAMYCLARQETSQTHRDRYLDAYRLLRRTLDDHGNAHFNMIDRVLEGPEAARDAETAALLIEWTRRGSRDFFVDWRGKVVACAEDRACAALPVADRTPTDFLWQRSPFQLFGGGDGFIESAGIDLLLPYWMGRFYGVL